MSAGGEIPRPDLAAALIERARHGAALLLTGPPGAGKTTLLLRAGAELARLGWVPVYLDFFGAVASPDRFVRAALRALPARHFSAHLQQAAELERLAGAGRLHGLEAVQALFELFATLEETDGRPVALLLDEPTEIRSLAYFKGLREAHLALGTALLRRRRGTLLATSFPTLAARSWNFETLAARPLAPPDLHAARPDLERRAFDLIALSAGWPRYLRPLLSGLQAGLEPMQAWTREMALGGALETACRHTYETLLLRSRGYGMSKAALQAVAHEEGLNLTALVARLGRTPGATRDYLLWLVGVDALRAPRKRYSYVDSVLRAFVVLHMGGTPPTREQLERQARELLARAAPAPHASTASLPAVTEPAPRAPRRDSLMEID